MAHNNVYKIQHQQHQQLQLSNEPSDLFTDRNI